MDRVETLYQKLGEQIQQQASIERLMVTVQMLQAELLQMKAVTTENQVVTGAAVQLPEMHFIPVEQAPKVIEPDLEIEKTILVLEMDEAEVEAEIAEIKRNAKKMEQMVSQQKPVLQFDPLEDIPTLSHQAPSRNETTRELHEMITGNASPSLNDKLKQQKTELSDALQDTPVKDLKKAIGINDRFLFIKELFRGDEVMYERSIKTINGFDIFPEAEYWIKRELKLKLGWNETDDAVKQFDQLVKRRFL